MLGISKIAILERLKKSRVAKGLSQNDVAEKIGLDRTAICKIESGARGLEIEELLELANLYGVMPEDFLSQYSTSFLSKEPLLDVLNILETQKNESKLIKEAILLIAGEAYKSNQISGGRYRELIQTHLVLEKL